MLKFRVEITHFDVHDIFLLTGLIFSRTPSLPPAQRLSCFLRQRETSLRLSIINHKRDTMSEYPYLTSLATSMVKSLLLRVPPGLGKRFAKVLAACGAKVVATGRRVDRLEALAKEIRADGVFVSPSRSI